MLLRCEDKERPERGGHRGGRLQQCRGRSDCDGRHGRDDHDSLGHGWEREWPCDPGGARGLFDLYARPGEPGLNREPPRPVHLARSALQRRGNQAGRHRARCCDLVRGSWYGHGGDPRFGHLVLLATCGGCRRDLETTPSQLDRRRNQIPPDGHGDRRETGRVDAVFRVPDGSRPGSRRRRSGDGQHRRAGRRLVRRRTKQCVGRSTVRRQPGAPEQGDRLEDVRSEFWVPSAVGCRERPHPRPSGHRVRRGRRVGIVHPEPESRFRDPWRVPLRERRLPDPDTARRRGRLARAVPHRPDRAGCSARLDGRRERVLADVHVVERRDPLDPSRRLFPRGDEP